MTPQQKRLVECWLVIAIFVAVLAFATKLPSAITGFVLLAYVGLRGDILKASQHFGVSPLREINERTDIKLWFFTLATMNLFIGLTTTLRGIKLLPNTFCVVLLLALLPFGPAIYAWQRKLYVLLGSTKP